MLSLLVQMVASLSVVISSPTHLQQEFYYVRDVVTNALQRYKILQVGRVLLAFVLPR